jgi:hypothetical protein
MSNVTTDGNFHTMDGMDVSHAVIDNDYYFYIFTQEKESNSPFVYLLYRYESHDQSFRQVQTDKNHDGRKSE